jgi:hypothetical protein
MENQRIYEEVIEMIENKRRMLMMLSVEMHKKKLLNEDYKYFNDDVIDFIKYDEFINIFIKTCGLTYKTKSLNYKLHPRLIFKDNQTGGGMSANGSTVMINVQCLCMLFNKEYSDYSQNSMATLALTAMIENNKIHEIYKLYTQQLNCSNYIKRLKNDIEYFIDDNLNKYYMDSVYYFLGNGWLDGIEGLINLKKYVDKQFNYKKRPNTNNINIPAITESTSDHYESSSEYSEPE